MQTTLHSFLLMTLAPGLSADDISEMCSPREQVLAWQLPTRLERRLASADGRLAELASYVRSEWLYGRTVTTDFCQRWALRNGADQKQAIRLASAV